MSEERLRAVYIQFFPQGSEWLLNDAAKCPSSSSSLLGANKYTHYLFSTIDRNHRGTFTFDVSALRMRRIGVRQRAVLAGLRCYFVRSVPGNDRRETAMDLSAVRYQQRWASDSRGEPDANGNDSIERRSVLEYEGDHSLAVRTSRPTESIRNR